MNLLVNLINLLANLK